MHEQLGQFVLLRKDIMSRDCGQWVRHQSGMTEKVADSDYDQGLIERTKIAREHSGLTQVAIAKKLGLEQDTYSKYETRSPIKQRYMLPFCAFTGASVEWLLSGLGVVPSDRRAPPSHGGEPPKKRGRKKAA